MATQKIDEISLESAKAAADLSKKQFTLVKLNSSGELEAAGAGDVAYVLQDKPTKGENGTYAVSGRVKAVAAEAINGGELVSSGAEGKVVKATATKVAEEKVKTLGTVVIGVALEKAAEGDIFAFRATPAAGRA